jgi:ADP-dependent NAD(P)H-hydrate dehydratase / NAD(P)H-hydrate epimerase
MLVTCRQMQEAEARAFASGVSAAALMEQAGCGIARVIRQFYTVPGTVRLYLGTGNNAGDALVAGRELRAAGWRLQARCVREPEAFKPLPLQHWQALGGIEPAEERASEGPLVCLDGLLGLGATGALRVDYAVLAAEMNRLRTEQGSSTVAMDLPSGLDGDSGVPGEAAVIADVTVTVAAVKRGLVADAAVDHVGRLALVPLPALAPFIMEGDAGAELLTPDLLRPWLPRRDHDCHKGQAGRVGVLAGSPGFYGAAELACLGALRAGAGLVTLLVREPEAQAVLAARLPAEVMVRRIDDARAAAEGFNALAVGPGLGFAHADEVAYLLREAPVPVVIDADALTLLAQHGLEPLRNAAGPRLLTPHPGEMRRLEESVGDRATCARTFADAHPGHTLLLKGARTVIACAGEPLRYNSTGHAGMATGGMGDFLSGVAAALLGQGLAPVRAASLAAWLCGRAAELAALEGAPESVLPSDLAAHLGLAWRQLREGRTP